MAASERLIAATRLAREMSIAELQQLRNYISMRLAVDDPKQGVDDKTARTARLLLQGIADVLRARGIDLAASSSRMQIGPMFRSFIAKVRTEGVAAYLHDAAKTEVELRALIKLCVELLIADMMRRHVAISSRSLMANVHLIPAVLDRAFPGYAAAGLLHMVIGRKRKETRDVWSE